MKPNLFVLLFGCLHAIVAAWVDKNTHYWRDYEKDLPRDAFPGGVDGRGKTIYIGWTHEARCDKLFVGGIFEEGQEMKFSYKQTEQQTKENVKILCIHDAGYLEWIKTSLEDMPTLKNRRLIIRIGKEQWWKSNEGPMFAKVYIGRVRADDQTSVGRIVIGAQPAMNGFYTTVDGKHLHVISSSFEVLGYKENYNGSGTTGSGTTGSGMPGSSNVASASHVIVVACVLRFLYSI